MSLRYNDFLELIEADQASSISIPYDHPTVLVVMSDGRRAEVNISSCKNFSSPSTELMKLLRKHNVNITFGSKEWFR